MGSDDDEEMVNAGQVGGGEGGKISPEAPDQTKDDASDPSQYGGDGDGSEKLQDTVDETADDLEQMEVEANDTLRHSVTILNNFDFQQITDAGGFAKQEYFFRTSTTFALAAGFQKFSQLRSEKRLGVNFRECTIGNCPMGNLTMDIWTKFFKCTEWMGRNGVIEGHRSAKTPHSRLDNSLEILSNTKYADDERWETRNYFQLRVRYFRQHGAKSNLAAKNLIIPNTNRGGARTPAGYTHEIGPLPRRIEEWHEPSSAIFNSAKKLIIDFPVYTNRRRSLLHSCLSPLGTTTVQ